ELPATSAHHLLPPPVSTATPCPMKDCAMTRRPSLSFTDARRRKLARGLDQIETLESRNMITESLGLCFAGIGIPGELMLVGGHEARGESVHQAAAQPVHEGAPGVSVALRRARLRLVQGGGFRVQASPVGSRVPRPSSSDWLPLSKKAANDGGAMLDT